MPSPLEGRRLWLAGIGGAGMSAYAVLARAWGAEVRGWDRTRTPYLEHLAAIDVEISDEPPQPPEGWEAFVSTAFSAHVPGKTRAELLAELVSLRDSIVVAGAHGKTTTSAMIAFCLEQLGRSPAWLIGADVPQLGGNAGTGEGWLVVEGDESDRTIAEPLAALELAGVSLDEAAPVLAEFRGAARRLEHRGTAANVDVYDDYAHHPAEIAATLDALKNGGRLFVLFQPHLYSRTRHLARELAGALAAADVVAVTDVYPAREQPLAGVTGKLVVDALADLRPGMPIWWVPSVDDGARFLVGLLRSGDRVVTMGAGDVDRAAGTILEALR